MEGENVQIMNLVVGDKIIVRDENRQAHKLIFLIRKLNFLFLIKNFK